VVAEARAAVAAVAAGARTGASGPGLDAVLEEAFATLVAARPTAVNLPAAVARMRRAAEASAGEPASRRLDLLEEEARRISDEDRAACLAIGRLGADWLEARIPPGAATLLTHCNAGALATAGIGTALGVVRALAARRPVVVLSDETRPFWQGARLTAWELMADGLDVTLVPDVAAASLIASGRVAAAVVGADRIAANGDVANKVGTYGVALACRAHGVPFVVAAPVSTVDLATPTGREIPIEIRSGEEVLSIPVPGGSVRVGPAGAKAFYPAFDVTPAALVDAIVTERGVSSPPHGAELARLAC
jgi:methylthioribose-1-phosphate isomerase